MFLSKIRDVGIGIALSHCMNDWCGEDYITDKFHARDKNSFDGVHERKNREVIPEMQPSTVDKNIYATPLNFLMMVYYRSRRILTLPKPASILMLIFPLASSKFELK